MPRDHHDFFQGFWDPLGKCQQSVVLIAVTIHIVSGYPNNKEIILEAYQMHDFASEQPFIILPFQKRPLSVFT